MAELENQQETTRGLYADVPMPGPIPPQPPCPPAPKPGWKSTEFWMAVGIQIVGILSASGVFTPEEASRWAKVVEMAGGLAAMVISSIAYSIIRMKTKVSASQAEAVKKGQDCQ